MNENFDAIATYTRLRTGSWGVRVPEAVQRLEPGDTGCVQVHKRNGRQNIETVSCFWVGEDFERRTRIALCKIVPRDTASPG